MARISRKMSWQEVLLFTLLLGGSLGFVFSCSACPLWIPDFGLILLYFWALYMPAHLPLAGVFGMGLLHDGLMGTPLGVFGLFYLLLSLFSHYQRRYLFKKSFFSGWAVFVVLVFISFMFKSAALVWVMHRPWPVDVLLYEGAVTILSYPFAVKAYFAFCRQFLDFLNHPLFVKGRP